MSVMASLKTLIRHARNTLHSISSMATITPKFRTTLTGSPVGSSSSLDELLKDDDLGGIDVEAQGIPPLGEPKQEKRFFFQKGIEYNENAIATQVCPLDSGQCGLVV